MSLRLRGHELDLEGGPPLIMGIVNLGDDSVADPLRLRTPAEQLRHARRQLAAGADIIDVGVQSGRTDTEPVSEREELGRLVPVVRALAADGARVSVDTWRPRVAEGVLAAGACLINDVSGLADPRVADLVATSGAGLVVMHTRARPKQERFDDYADPVADVLAFLRERAAAALERGVSRERLLVDPGLDFAKTPEQSIEVLRRLPELQALGLPILLAVSRKYFLGMLTGALPADRLAGTLAAVGFGVSRGARIVRVHDVAAVREFLRVHHALRTDAPPVLLGDRDDPSLKWLPAPERAS
jgi:dihydropteroate synthase